MNCKMSANLKGAMVDLIDVFHKYSGKEGDKYTLTKLELKNLLKNELGEFLEKIMRELDDNKDGVVDFQEFVGLVAALTVACNEFFKSDSS
uniref:Protein S100 n=1 Tax=Oreochromis aureus TaxID=47969 RepID=A0AAZ1XPY9_OREAU